MQQRHAILALVCASVATAQSPCTPPSSFATNWRGTTYLSAPSAQHGTNLVFDLTLDGPISLAQIDVNLLDDGSLAGTPNLTGRTTQLILWTTTGTWNGQVENAIAPGTAPSGWTQAGIGTLTVATADQHSIATFSPPIVLAAGTYGIALQHMPVAATATSTGGPLHPLYTNPAIEPTPLLANDQFLAFTAGAVQSDAWASPVYAPRVANLELHYTPAAGSGYTTVYGRGCYSSPASFYEVFDTAHAFDLSHTTIALQNNGATWTATHTATSTITAPRSNSLLLSAPALSSTTPATWDDALTAPITLPFTFPFPGGSTDTILISSNGAVCLAPTSTVSGFDGGIAAFLADAPRLAPWFADLDPTAITDPAGGLFYDIDATGQSVTITWMSVPHWNQPASSNTVQLMLDQGGNVELRYGACSATATSVLVGWTPGHGATDPKSMDLTASMPFASGDGGLAPNLAADTRPVFGRTVHLVTADARTGTQFGLLLFGLTALPMGADLALVGMPGCSQYLIPTGSSLFLVNGNVGSSPLPIPANVALAGLQIVAQSAILFGGLNATGILTSNAVCLNLGL